MMKTSRMHPVCHLATTAPPSERTHRPKGTWGTRQKIDRGSRRASTKISQLEEGIQYKPQINMIHGPELLQVPSIRDDILRNHTSFF